MSAQDSLITALQGEYAAVYLYGLIGGRADRDDDSAEITRINTVYAAHRLRRDQLIAFLTARGLTVPAPAVAYTPPVDPTDAAHRTACAQQIEVRLEPIYAQLVGATTGPERAFALTALSSVSAAAVQVGQAPTAFPGLTLA